ncbi:diguanylate cyclase (GGDEF) domain-containing protein [Andreprevotia lacus DSM 23236]|jgi:diguanylate cyclase (GGDEF)-like protein|uniref:Diguanylate cyclase (GGDEF) domain-containing protein n=1 Tax=Andreprevotia lacus DSM 23236 TaxID=1121001 RepID=A0A1W1XSV7_9NEIS|nr:EAL domain-containing protein [Andreprevotia lacus]SMC26618.1 diguanylate cyclase (GGDEF) domain-containing protein [Andreprevotia lacus DSM 23236]
MPSSSLFDSQTRRQWRHVWLLGVMLCASALILLAWESWDDYRSSEAQYRRRLLSAARLITQQFDQTMTQSVASVDNIGTELAVRANRDPLDGVDYLDVLRTAARYDTQSSHLFVLDEQQLWLIDRTGRLEGRLGVQDSIKAAVAANGGQTLGLPLQVQADGPLLLPVLRHYTLRNGHRIVVGLLLPPQRFDEMYRRLIGSPGLTFGLVRNDSRLLLCIPTLNDPRSGQTVTLQQDSFGALLQAPCGPLAAQPRRGLFMLSPSSLHAYSIFYGVDRSTYLDMWRQRLQWRITSLFILGCVIALFSHLLRRFVRQLVQQGSFHRQMFLTVNDGILLLDKGKVVDANDAACELFGVFGSDALMGRSLAELSPLLQPDGQPSGLHGAELLDAAAQGILNGFNWQLQRLDNHQPFDSEVRLNAFQHDEQRQLLMAIRDVSEAQHYLAQQEYLANHDLLTKLPNRYWLSRRLDGLIASQPQQPMALLVLDLNRFKEINDTLGHQAGDEILRTLGTRLSDWVRQHGADTARLGGDELAVVLPYDGHDGTLAQACDDIAAVIREPLWAGNLALELTASIGVALYPQHGSDTVSLARCADIAMYEAKRNRHHVSIYRAGMDRFTPERLALHGELAQAIREDGLALVYQPKVNVHDGKLAGCEALLRWQHPERGMISPVEFIPMAENSELIRPLTAWVIDHALAQVRLWLDAGLNIPVAVNISARNLLDADLVGLVVDSLRRHNVPPALLELEVTESALLEDPETALSRLTRLHGLGIRMAIDDFGTGYSSLAYLKRLPVQVLKIDRTFIAPLVTSQPDALIVQSTIGLAHSFGLQVVAEGVEDGAILDVLRSMGCDLAQGYHIARPQPPAAFEAWSREHRSA